MIFVRIEIEANDIHTIAEYGPLENFDIALALANEANRGADEYYNKEEIQTTDQSENHQ